jgi:sugar O-acyltransferase (sialic acid O-acetyltransferase NeuD family)
MTSNIKVLVWGKGGLSHQITDILDSYNMSWYKLNDEDPRVLNNSWLQIFSFHYFFVAIGDNYIRERKFFELETLGIKPITLKAKSCCISPNAMIEDGVCIRELAYVGPQTYIKRGTIVGPGSIVAHHNNLEEFVLIGPGVNLCGTVTIGKRTLIGSGSNIVPKTSIAADCIVAGGSSIRHSINIENSLWAGNPVTLKRMLK